MSKRRGTGQQSDRSRHEGFHTFFVANARVTYKEEMHDVTILGAGLAGSAVAWAARRAGLTVALIDRGEASASRIAAGLVTPVTGQRLVKTLRHDELIPAALGHYQQVETETRQTFVIPQPIVRLFRTEKERTVFANRQHGEFEGLVSTPVPPLDSQFFNTTTGAFEMPTAWRLDVPTYLDATWNAFAPHTFTADLDPLTDITASPEGLAIGKLGIQTKYVVLCVGFLAWALPWFQHIAHNHAKGEVLDLEVQDLTESRIVNRGTWLAPTGCGRALAGATYEWDDLSPTPTEQRRQEIELGLRTFVNGQWKVVGHHAAVRAISTDRNPILGLCQNRIYVFTGLGSKGVLWAPFYAEQLVKHLTHSQPIEAEVSLQRWGRG